MGLWDNIKNIMTIPDEEEDFEEEAVEETSSKNYEEDDYFESAPSKRAEAPKIIKRTSSFQKPQGNTQGGQMQVFLAKPERFDDVTGIADHLNAGRTVVLNLEDTNKDVARRIVDFLSGAAYANGGNMKKVAKNTFIIAARGVDVAGELMIDDIDDGRYYY